MAQAKESILQIETKYGWDNYVDKRFKPYMKVIFPSVKKAEEARTRLGSGSIYWTRIVSANSKRIIVPKGERNSFDPDMRIN